MFTFSLRRTRSSPFSLCIIIEIMDIECVLDILAGAHTEKIALINPAYWICPRSGLWDTMGRVYFALIDRQFCILMWHHFVYLKIDRSTHSISIISMRKILKVY